MRQCLLDQNLAVYVCHVNDPLIDRETPETAIEELLRCRIENSRALLVVLDSHHAAAPWCGWEVDEFVREHGADAPVYYVAFDFTPVFFRAPARPWSFGSAWPRLHSRTQALAADSPLTGLFSLWLAPEAWSLALGLPATGGRLLGRVTQAIRFKGDPWLPPGTLRACAPALFVVLVGLAVAAVVATFLGLGTWQRQWSLIAAAAASSGVLLALTLDLAAVLGAASVATIASLGVTWVDAITTQRSTNGSLAGGVLAGTLVGMTVALRLRQRARENRPVRHLRSFVAGLGSVTLSLVVLRLIFDTTAQKTFGQSAPPITGTGTLVGALAGVQGGVALGRARAISVRGRGRLRSALPIAIATFVALTSAGWWSQTEGAQLVVQSSAAYGAQMGLLVGMLMLGAMGLHGALTGWTQRAGDDALYGAMTLLLLPAVLADPIREAVPAYLGAAREQEWSTLTRSFAVANVVSFALGSVLQPSVRQKLQAALDPSRRSPRPVSDRIHHDRPVALLLSTALGVLLYEQLEAKGDGSSETQAPPSPKPDGSSRENSRPPITVAPVPEGPSSAQTSSSTETPPVDDTQLVSPLDLLDIESSVSRASEQLQRAEEDAEKAGEFAASLNVRVRSLAPELAQKVDENAKAAEQAKAEAKHLLERLVALDKEARSGQAKSPVSELREQARQLAAAGQDAASRSATARGAAEESAAGAKEPREICETFTACVDGSDYISVADGRYRIRHRLHAELGSHSDCSEDLRGHVRIDGNRVPLPEPNSKIWKSEREELIDDDERSGARPHTRTLCGPDR